MTTSCSPRWLHIELPLLHSVSVGESLAVSGLAYKCGPPCTKHLQHLKHLKHLKQEYARFCTEKPHDIGHVGFIAAPGNLKSP
jgi:hypothetical protein